MSEAPASTPTPTQSQTAAKPEAPAGQPTGAQQPTHHQDSFDRGFGKAMEKFHAAEEAHKAELAKYQAQIADLSKSAKEAQDWRMNALESRAKAAGVTETVAKLAKEKGPSEYEAIIGEFEKLKPATTAPAATPAKPVTQPGGEVGGSEGININLDLIDPLTNPGGAAAAFKAYEQAAKQYTRKVVDDALAKRAAQRR